MTDIEADLMIANAEIKRLQAQLEAAISGQETLQKALAASQRRERAAVEELIQRCTPKAAELLKRGLFGAVKVCAVDETIQKTNADRIRGMSDEELAEFLSAAYFDGFNDGLIHRVEPHKYTIDWLQQPAETEGKK